MQLKTKDEIYSARDSYRIEREDKAGEGYADFIFYPDCKSADAFTEKLRNMPVK